MSRLAATQNCTKPQAHTQQPGDAAELATLDCTCEIRTSCEEGSGKRRLPKDMQGILIVTYDYCRHHSTAWNVQLVKEDPKHGPASGYLHRCNSINIHVGHLWLRHLGDPLMVLTSSCDEIYLAESLMVTSHSHKKLGSRSYLVHVAFFRVEKQHL